MEATYRMRSSDGTRLLEVVRGLRKGLLKEFNELINACLLNICSVVDIVLGFKNILYISQLFLTVTK